MFDELKSTIRHDITHTIFRVTLTREPVQRRPGPMIESRPDVTGGGAEGGSSAVRRGERQRIRPERRREEERPQDRAQRPVLVRIGEEVQALPRSLIAAPNTRGWRGARIPATIRVRDREAR